MPKLRTFLTPLFLLLGWQLMAGSGLVSAYLLPSPLTVGKTAVIMWRSGMLFSHIKTSLFHVSAGFCLSALAGFFFAGLTARFTLARELTEAPFSLLRMIPPLAMIPLLILWLGIGQATLMAVIILACFFPIFLSTRDGLCRVSETHRELARSLNLSTWVYATRIVIPSAIPSIITGLRLAFGYSWRSLIGAELIASSSGLGYLIMDAQDMMRTDEVLVGILVIGLIGWGLDSLFQKVVIRLLHRRFPEIAE
jgi:ABC-type nitrate/sulfonate/bicarbonate transport system permease component